MKIAGPVLVASDLSPASDEVIRQAATLAQKAGVGLIACHVMPELLRIRPLFPHLRDEDRKETERLREVVSEALGQQLQRVLPRGMPPPEVRLDAGSPHAVLLQAAQELEAGLIVIGLDADRGSGSLAGVTERLARHSKCPVLTVAAGRGIAVVAATDFSDPALPAVQLGREEAERRGLPLVIVNAIDLRTSQLDLPEIVSPSLISRVIESVRREASERIAELVKRVGPSARVELREGPAIDEILAVADETRADLIVVGTHGGSSLGWLALGSVAEGVMRRATCSTLVVRLEPWRDASGDRLGPSRRSRTGTRR